MNYTSKNLLYIFVVFKKVMTINYTLFIIDFIVGVSGGVLYYIILRKEQFEIYQLATEYIIMLGINIPRLSYVMSVWLNITTICPLLRPTRCLRQSSNQPEQPTVQQSQYQYKSSNTV